MKIYGGFSWPRPLKGSLLLASMFGCSILGNIARDILKEKMRKPRQRGEGPGEFTVLSTIFNFRDLYIYIYPQINHYFIQENKNRFHPVAAECINKCIGKFIAHDLQMGLEIKLFYMH